MSECPPSPVKKQAIGSSQFRTTSSCPTCPLDASISLGNWRAVQQAGIYTGKCCAACRERIGFLASGVSLETSMQSLPDLQPRVITSGRMTPPSLELGSNIA